MEWVHQSLKFLVTRKFLRSRKFFGSLEILSSAGNTPLGSLNLLVSYLNTNQLFYYNLSTVIIRNFIPSEKSHLRDWSGTLVFGAASLRERT